MYCTDCDTNYSNIILIFFFVNLEILLSNLEKCYPVNDVLNLFIIASSELHPNIGKVKVKGLTSKGGNIDLPISHTKKTKRFSWSCYDICQI